jgi:dihydrofolate reductase
MIISLIAALGQRGELGYQNDLLWRVSADLKNFKRLTMGKHLLMGRKTFESLGGPLEGREILVLSRNPMLELPGARVVSSFDQAQSIAKDELAPELVICGGGEIYRHFMDQATRLYLTRIHDAKDADTYFPDVDFSRYNLIEKLHHEKTESAPAWDFEVYEKIS